MEQPRQRPRCGRTPRPPTTRRSSTASTSTAAGAVSPSKAAPTPAPRSPSSRAAAGSRCAAMPRLQGARLETDGRAADLFRGLQIDAATIVSGNSLAALASGDRSAPGRAAALSRRRAAPAPTMPPTPSSRPGRRSARTDLAGDLAWSRRGERPSFSATLASDATDLADLLWLAGKGVAPSPPASKAARAVGAAASPAAARDPFARAREVDGAVAFQAKRFRVADGAAAAEPEARGQARRRRAGGLGPRRRLGRRPHDRHDRPRPAADNRPARKRSSRPAAFASSRCFRRATTSSASPACCTLTRR